MPWYQNQPYTSFRGVNNKDGKTRLQSGAYGLTSSVTTLSANRTLQLPDADVQFKNVGGSVLVGGYGTASLPHWSIAALSVQNTIIVDGGIKPNDGIISQLTNSDGSACTVVASVPSNGSYTLYISNPDGTGTVGQAISATFTVGYFYFRY